MTEADRETLFILDGVEFGAAYIAMDKNPSKLRVWTQRAGLEQWLIHVEFESIFGMVVTKTFRLYWPQIMKKKQESKRRKMLYDVILKALKREGVL